MQTRLFNYKEDDSTFLLNKMTIGLIPAGVYFGFDADLDNTLILKLIHSISGMSEIDIELNESIVGLIKSKQGTIIKENNTIELPIDAGDSLPRIDLIVCSHSYTETVGGSQALYSIIKGTPASTPIKPNLTSENEQIEIGSLYVPENMLLLNGAGVIYTKADQPQFANNTTRISNIISSIANCLQKSQNLNDLLNKTTARTNLDVLSVSEVNTAISNALYGISSFLSKSENLNDLSNKITARSNLNVYSQEEIESLISAAIANLAIIGTALDATQLVLTDSSGHLISEAKKTALNKDFTTTGEDNGSGTDVARGDHKHDSIYYTETEINTVVSNIYTAISNNASITYKVGDKQTLTEVTNGGAIPVTIDRYCSANTTYQIIDYTGNGEPDFDKLKFHLHSSINEILISASATVLSILGKAKILLVFPNGLEIGISEQSGQGNQTFQYTIKKISNSNNWLITSLSDGSTGIYTD